MFFKKKFFNKEEEQKIVHAIRAAEKNTSGELRVHLSPKVKTTILDDGLHYFKKLKMHKTAQRNGVLIFIAYQTKEFCIIGDEGIHAKVPENFWDSVKNAMTEKFIEGNIVEGIAQGLQLSGEQLKAFFPLLSNDKNELNDTIFYGE
ncbi:MAG: TPM domain-containing protein [Bacteroidetes bacterium]|nr:TPM domain-containing protein [Bacteroidota bacterium]